LRIIISDDGKGIAEDKQRHLFTPFERLEQVGDTISDTGIGLSFAKNMADKMNT